MLADNLYPPHSYELIWLIIGIIVFVALVLYMVAIFFFTRHKDIRTIKNLPIITSAPVDLSQLRAKYLEFISKIEQNYNSRKIKSAVAHQQLSVTIRYFAFEASGFRAHLMTLSDLMQADRGHLAETIKSYYAPEFDGLDVGSVADSTKLARRIVEEWH